MARVEGAATIQGAYQPPREAPVPEEVKCEHVGCQVKEVSL